MEVRLTRRPLSVGAAYRALERPGAGGIVVFVGRVRGDVTRAGRVVALDYEADAPLAIRALDRVVRRTRARHAAVRLLLWHRVGRLRVGEVSVIAGAACGHRAAAFAAARRLIEELKRSVPIWKTDRARPARRPPRRRPRRIGRRAG